MPVNGKLRRRVTPSFPLALELPEDAGQKLTLDLRLAFDFNALSAVEEATGFSPLSGDIWNHLTARTVGALFWASLLAHQPEYEGVEGLAIARSYMDASNAAVITHAVMEAFIVSLPPEQQKIMREKGRLNPTPAATDSALAGSTSGPSPDTTSGSANAASGV
jgi:hypothetical protein